MASNCLPALAQSLEIAKSHLELFSKMNIRPEGPVALETKPDVNAGIREVFICVN